MTVAEDKRIADAEAKLRRTVVEPKAVPDATVATGRCAVMHCLDCVLAHPANIAAFARAFQDAIDDDPLGLLKSIIMPLTPKATADESAGPVVTAESVAAQLLAMSGLVAPAGRTLQEAEDHE